MNKTLQEEGYYMGDFEFKMLGIAYYLDKGFYFKSLKRLSDFHKLLQNRENLIKMPEFKSKNEELEFYLELQNPRTGAFMDDSYPYCTYNEPTENIVAHLDALANETGLDSQSLSMGNWTSRESVVLKMESMKIDEIPVYENNFPVETANQLLRKNGKLEIFGFDILQIPRYKIVYLYTADIKD